MATETPETVTDVLRKAREILTSQGWSGIDDPSRKDHTWGGHTCLFLAINDAGREVAQLRYDALERVQSMIEFPHIIEWNDAPGRTEAEVFAALDRAIEAAS